MKVLHLFKDNKIIPIYIPGGCTDVLQIGDLVLNTPFKLGMKKAFTALTHQSFNNHLEDGNDPATFSFKLTTVLLKLHISKFVQSGMEAISTPSIKTTLRDSFLIKALVSKARLPARYEEAKANLLKLQSF